MTKVADQEVEEIQLDEAALKAISDQTREAILPELKTLLEDSNKSITEAIDQFKADQEEVNKKITAKGAAGDEGDEDEDKDAEKSFVEKGIEDGTIDKEIAEMSAAMRFTRGMQALVAEDSTELKRYNSFARAAQMDARKEVEGKGQEAVAKTGYANSTTAADGSVLLPDAEFVTTVFENLPNYGVAFQYADVRNTDRPSVRVISLDSGLTFYRTAEAGVKTSAKLQFSKNEQSLLKYAVIVPAADELTDDSAIDYWNIVTKELTRAYAKVADEITFIDTTTGITNLTGVLTENVSGAGTSITWNDLLDAQAKTEDDLDTSNFKWFMRKETWFRLVQLRGTTNDHYLSGSLNTATGWVANPNQPTTPWGTPVVFTRVLPSSNSVQTNDAFAVYGDLSNYILYNKRGMALKMLTEATILDADSVSTNLATQDISAMRAVIRLLGICPKGNRSKFVVLGTGTVS